MKPKRKKEKESTKKKVRKEQKKEKEERLQIKGKQERRTKKMKEDKEKINERRTKDWKKKTIQREKLILMFFVEGLSDQTILHVQYVRLFAFLMEFIHYYQ